MGEFAVGQPVPRFEDPRLLRGGGRYVDDMVLPRMAFGHVLRSPYAHARIRRIDVAKGQLVGDDLLPVNVGTGSADLAGLWGLARGSFGIDLDGSIDADYQLTLQCSRVTSSSATYPQPSPQDQSRRPAKRKRRSAHCKRRLRRTADRPRC